MELPEVGDHDDDDDDEVFFGDADAIRKRFEMKNNWTLYNKISQTELKINLYSL